MLSVLIATHNAERTLGQALAALVPAAVDGLVREVILADGGSTDGTLAIADDAGARVVQGDLAAAAGAARAEWLLVLDGGPEMPVGWERAVAAALKTAGQASWWGQAPLLGRKRAGGLLAPKDQFQAAGFAGTLAKARRLKIS